MNFSKKELLNKNNRKLIDEEIKNEIKNKIKRISVSKDYKNMKRSNKNFPLLNNKALFFKIKNKLKFKFGFKKTELIPIYLKKI